MKKITKELLTGVVALGMLAPVATSALNPINITVNARRRTHRHYRRGRRHARHIRRYRSRRSYRVTGYSRWFARNGKRFYRRYHNSRSFMNGMNDGLNGGTHDNGALLSMDSVHHNLYYKGWVIANAIAQTDPSIYDGYRRVSPSHYARAIGLYNQGRRYGDRTGDEYLQYQDGSWSQLDASDASNIGYNSNVLATLNGNYRV